MNMMAIFPTFLPRAFLVIYMSAATVIILKGPMSLKSGCEEMFYFCHYYWDKDTVAANAGLWYLSVTLKTSKRVCNLFACACYCFKLTITC